MSVNRLPKYLILIRWGAFRVDLVGRMQVIMQRLRSQPRLSV